MVPHLAVKVKNHSSNKTVVEVLARRKKVRHVGKKTRVKRRCRYVVAGVEFRKKSAAKRALNAARKRR